MALRYSKIKKAIIISIVLLAIILILRILSYNQFIAEYVFARGISRAYIYVIGNITSLFPFSIFELFILITAITIIILIIKMVKMLSKRCYFLVAKNFVRIINIVLAITLLYSITASMSYKRNQVENYLPQYNEIPDNEYIFNMARYYINEYNELSASLDRDSNGNIKFPYTNSELYELIALEFDKLDDSYFSSFTPKVKTLLSSPIWSAFSITGVSFQPTAEPNINSNQPLLYLPHTMAHEIAHSKGVMWESDAELVADYITLTSKNKYIKYSGLTCLLNDIFQMTIYADEPDVYTEIYQLIAKSCWIDISYANNIYSTKFGLLDKIGEFINDLYLKSNGATNGVDSYTPPSDVIEIENPENPGEIIHYVINYSNSQKLLLAIYERTLS
ncbi:MAG: DUF3810 domain-containing protein [Christensenellaceae bacterium]|jgi:hypothetical protein|nr:DUF3810 domain-containing protein [Christensenellaceae bacterium]